MWISNNLWHVKINLMFQRQFQIPFSVLLVQEEPQFVECGHWDGKEY